MASITPTVFLASRFAEFRPIRQAVKDLLRNHPAIACNVVDLEENYPHHDPPLLISQDHARSSDIMVLLVGPSYGTVPDGQKRSYTHLEYEAACGRNSKAAVLAYLADGVTNTHHPGLRELYRDIDRRHTWSRLDAAKQPSETAFEIVQAVQRQAFSLITTVSRLPDAELGIEDDADEGAAGDAVEEDRRIENDPHLRLEPRAVERPNQLDLLANPARAAADEQKREAVRALEVGEWRRAVWHLDQARQRQPWDLPTLFWGARLKLISGRRDDSRSGLALAARAARVAEKEIDKGKREIPLAACHMLAARAASQTGDTRSGVEFAGKAVEVAKWYWLTHYELARQNAHHGNGTTAADALRSAFFLRPTVWSTVRRDPAFAPCRRECDEAWKKIDHDVRADVGRILLAEDTLWLRLRELAEGYGLEMPRLYPDWLAEAAATLAAQRAGIEHEVLLRVIERAKGSFKRQVEGLTRLAAQAVALDEAEAMLSVEAERVRREHEGVRRGLEAELAQAASEEWDRTFRMDGTTFFIGLFVAVAVGLTAGDTWGWPGIVLGLVVAVVGWLLAMGEGFSDAEKSFADRKKSQVKWWEQALREAREKEFEECTLAGEEADTAREALLTALRLFVGGVDEMERTCLGRRIYAPTPALNSAKVGEMVVLSPAKYSAGYTLDDRLLPEPLAARLPDVPAPPAANRLYRLLPGENAPASRQACYFGAA